MISDELGIELHDRWTRGQALTAEEQFQLEGWYQLRDAAENEKLSQVLSSAEGSELQEQIEMVLTRLTTTMQQVQQVTTENEILRKDISLLQHQLATPKSA